MNIMSVDLIVESFKESFRFSGCEAQNEGALRDALLSTHLRNNIYSPLSKIVVEPVRTPHHMGEIILRGILDHSFLDEVVIKHIDWNFLEKHFLPSWPLHLELIKQNEVLRNNMLVSSSNYSLVGQARYTHNNEFENYGDSFVFGYVLVPSTQSFEIGKLNRPFWSSPSHTGLFFAFHFWKQFSE